VFMALYAYALSARSSARGSQLPVLGGVVTAGLLSADASLKLLLPVYPAVETSSATPPEVKTCPPLVPVELTRTTVEGEGVSFLWPLLLRKLLGLSTVFTHGWVPCDTEVDVNDGDDNDDVGASPTAGAIRRALGWRGGAAAVVFPTVSVASVAVMATVESGWEAMANGSGGDIATA
jgi:hypothetical protein